MSWKRWHVFALSALMASSVGAAYRNPKSGSWGPVRVETGTLLLTAQDLSIQALPRNISFSRAYSPDAGWTFLVTTPTQFVVSATEKTVFEVDVARIQPGLFNQYAFSLNNPAAFRSALGTEKLERQSVADSPWKWYLLLQ